MCTATGLTASRAAAGGRARQCGAVYAGFQRQAQAEEQLTWYTAGG